MEKEKTVRILINNKIIFYNKAQDVIYDNMNKEKTINNGNEYQRILANDIYDTIYEVTTKCNQFCENCFSESDSTSKEEMDFEFIYKDILSKQKDRIRVAITGGEPFLHSEIERILNLPTIFKDIEFVINTNGNYFLREKLYDLVVNNDWLVTYSIHGKKATHNCYTNSAGYDAIVNNIKMLQGKVCMHIYSVINRYMSKEDIDDVILLKEKYDIDFVRFIIPRNFGRVLPVYDEKLVSYIREVSSGRSDVGIKSEKSLSELINVNKISRLAR